MIKNAMYFGKRDLYNLIKRVGGEWNDTKDRPIFCCIESLELERPQPTASDGDSRKPAAF